MFRGDQVYFREANEFRFIFFFCFTIPPLCRLSLSFSFPCHSLLPTSLSLTPRRRTADVPHRPLLGPLDELDLALVKVRDGGLEGRDGDADVAKALGLLVAVVVGLALFELGSWIMEKRKEKKIDCKPRDRASERASGAFFFFFFFGFPFCSTRGWCPCLDTLKQISLSLSPSHRGCASARGSSAC